MNLAIAAGTLNVVRAQIKIDDGWEAKAGGKMSFEVASIRQGSGGSRASFALDVGDGYAATGGRFSANFSLSTYISFAYKVSITPEQNQAILAHLPKWVAEDRFDIQAQASDDNPTKDQMRLMMQDLLAERFKLAVHFETRETSVFALVQVKPGTLGPNLRLHSQGPSCEDTPPPGVFPPKCHVMAIRREPTKGLTRTGSRDAAMPLIAATLPLMDRLDRPVMDRTGLSGEFDFILEWAREIGPPQGQGKAPPPDPQGPSFQQALREQLGLKLESAKAPLQILIIDHIERPSEN